MERILGLDIGTVRIGLALSDPLGITAQPLETIQRKKCDPIERIREIVEEYSISKLVIGNPLTLNGKSSFASEKVAEFVEKLQKCLQLECILWDERMTTAQAEKLMISSGVRRQKRRESIDQVASAIILQSYLDAHQS